MLTLKQFRKAVRGLPDTTPIEVQSWADDPEDFDGKCDDVYVYARSEGKVIMLQCNSESDDELDDVVGDPYRND